MKNKKHLTNVQVVKQIMESGSPMNQLFVMECIIKWSNIIIENEKDVLKRLENTMVHGPAWVDAAKHCKRLMDEHYAS